MTFEEGIKEVIEKYASLFSTREEALAYFHDDPHIFEGVLLSYIMQKVGPIEAHLDQQDYFNVGAYKRISSISENTFPQSIK
jgi:hypothetical protein